MKLSPSNCYIKLFLDLRRPSPGSKVLLGTLIAFSFLTSISHFQSLDLPFIKFAAATPQSINPPLFGDPTTEDFLSYAIAIMPTVPGANLNTSNIAGSTNCDLLVPVTYIDAGCMNSLPLLFPFEEPQPQQINNTEPTNQSSIYSNFGNSSVMDLSIGVASDNVTAGDTQTLTVTVSDQNSTQPIQGALVLANVTDSFNTLQHEYSGTSDEVGQVSFPFVIPVDALADIYNVDILASAEGYENASASTTFEVIGSGDFFFDNSTSDDFDDFSDSSSDDCCDSDDDNDDFNSPTVKSTDPGNNDKNVPIDLSEIKVTFDESIDKDSIDSGSLSLFANNCGNVFCSTPNIQDVSVSSKSATFQIDQSSIDDLFTPGVTYIASISSSIQDEDGNFLDCFDSKGVDDSCEWDFSITDDNTSPTVVSTNPNSGATGVQVTSAVTATFSEVVVVPSDAFTLKDSSGTLVLGTVSFPLGTTATFTPNNPLSGSTTYTATIKGGSSGVEDLAGNPLSPDKVWSFTTASETIPPTVESTIPASGTTGVSVVDPISATFSEAIQDSTVTASTFTVNDGASNIGGTFSFSTDDKTVTFTPSAQLSFSTPYTATITTGVKDLDGNSLASNKEWIFTTTVAETIPPTVEGTSPVDGAQNVPLSSGISATFSEAMSKSTITDNTFTVDSGSTSIPGTVTLSSDGKTASFDPTANLAISTPYTAIVTTGVKDLAGNPMTSPETWTFTTTSVALSGFSSSNIAKSPDTVVGTAFNNQTNSSSSSVNQSDVSNSTTKNVKSTIPKSVVDDESGISKSDTNNSKGSAPVVPSGITVKNETSQDESNKPLPDAKVKNKDTSSNESDAQSTQNSLTEKPSPVTEDKTIAKVTSSDSENQQEKQLKSTDTREEQDRALFYKYLNRDDDKDKITSEQIEVNNRPVAINDESTTESNIPVKINILSNDKDPDGDKLSLIGVSRPSKGTIESDDDGTITYSPLKSWAGTERFTYSISDGRGGVATSTVTVIVQNHPPEAEDQDVSVNANSPIKIKLEAKDPDEDKMKFVLGAKPSHGRIVQFSSSTGTLAYVPDQNYDGKDEFTFKVHDGTEFSKDAKVSIKIEKNEKLSNDQVRENDRQPNRERPSQGPSDEKQSTDDKSNNNDTPPSDSNDQSASPTQDDEQQNSDVKEEQKQSSESEKSIDDAESSSSGDSQPSPDS